jgi:hypothetical protein
VKVEPYATVKADMFSRRSIQRSLDDLVGVLNSEQLEKAVQRLRAETVREQIATEWEIMILAALARTASSLRHEGDHGGKSRPDVFVTFQDANLVFLADIGTVSDADMEDVNPVEYFREAIFAAARKLGMTSAGLGVHVNSRPMLKKTQREVLALPPKADIISFIRNNVIPFLKEIIRDPLSNQEQRYEIEQIQFTLKYTANETNFSFGSWQTYHWSRAPTHNPLYGML